MRLTPLVLLLLCAAIETWAISSCVTGKEPEIRVYAVTVKLDSIAVHQRWLQPDEYELHWVNVDKNKAYRMLEIVDDTTHLYIGKVVTTKIR
jgi:hypothetical protein